MVFKKGNIPWNKGKRHSETTKDKISEKLKGNSNARGVKHPYLAEYNKTHIRKGSDNPNYGKRTLRGIPKSMEWKQNISKIRIERGLSKGDKNPMRDERNIIKWIKSCGIKPNKAELRLNNILQEILPSEYLLNVSGGVGIIGGKIPDFMNVNGRKKVIELFGDYHHSKEFSENLGRKWVSPKERIAHFKEYGFDCLVIWERELKDINLVSQKLSEFHNIPCKKLVTLSDFGVDI